MQENPFFFIFYLHSINALPRCSVLLHSHLLSFPFHSSTHSLPCLMFIAWQQKNLLPHTPSGTGSSSSQWATSYRDPKQRYLYVSRTYIYVYMYVYECVWLRQEYVSVSVSVHFKRWSWRWWVKDKMFKMDRISERDEGRREDKRRNKRGEEMNWLKRQIKQKCKEGNGTLVVCGDSVSHNWCHSFQH